MKKKVANKIAAMTAALMMTTSCIAPVSSLIADAASGYQHTISEKIVVKDYPYIEFTKEAWELEDNDTLAYYESTGKTYMKSRVVIYSTRLSEGEFTKVAELSGGDADIVGEEALPYDSKYTWVAVRQQGGTEDSHTFGWISYFYLDRATLKWENFGGWNMRTAMNGATHVTLTENTAERSGIDKAFEGLTALRYYKDTNSDNKYSADEMIASVDSDGYKHSGNIHSKEDLIIHPDWTNPVYIDIEPDMSYMKYLWEADVKRTRDLGYAKRTDDYRYTGGLVSPRYMAIISKKNYGISFEGDVPQIGKEFPSAKPPVPTEVPVTNDALIPNLLPSNANTDEDGHLLNPIKEVKLDPAVTTKPTEGAHGKVYLLENADVIEEYTADEFDNCYYCVKDYNPDNTYFIAIEKGIDKTKSQSDKSYCHYDIYRWDPVLQYWEFRVNTEENSIAVPISPTAYPDEDAGCTLRMKATSYEGLKDTHGYDVEDTKGTTKAGEWTRGQFNSGTEFVEIYTQNFMPGDVFYTNKFDYGDGEAYYRYVGIDPVLVKTTGSRTDSPKTNTVPTNARVGDTVVVQSIDDEGNPVCYQVPITGVGDVPVRDGESRLIDMTTGNYADIVVEDGKLVSQSPDSSNKDVVNVAENIYDNIYTLSLPNGEKLEDGTVYDDVFDSANDLKTPLDELDNTSAYFMYRNDVGTINSKFPDRVKRDSGYLMIGSDKKFDLIHLDSDLKGDVDVDGDIDVTDLLLLQKYILNVKSFTPENFINADMDADGRVDVFDLGLLKNTLLNLNEKHEVEISFKRGINVSKADYDYATLFALGDTAGSIPKIVAGVLTTERGANYISSSNVRDLEALKKNSVVEMYLTPEELKDGKVFDNYTLTKKYVLVVCVTSADGNTSTVLKYKFNRVSKTWEIIY